MRKTRLGALLMVVSGCAAGAGGAPAKPAPVVTDVTRISEGPGTEHFVLDLSGGAHISVLVGDRAITGPNVSLSRYTDPTDHSLRGDAWKQVVNLDITATGVKGIYGGGPINLEVARVGEELQITGTVAGKITDFKMGPAGIFGSVGQCMFQMNRQGAGYSGSAGCRSGTRPANLTFPASFGTWSLPEMGAALVILLSAGS